MKRAIIEYDGVVAYNDPRHSKTLFVQHFGKKLTRNKKGKLVYVYYPNAVVDQIKFDVIKNGIDEFMRRVDAQYYENNAFDYHAFLNRDRYVC